MPVSATLVTEKLTARQYVQESCMQSPPTCGVVRTGVQQHSRAGWRLGQYGGHALKVQSPAKFTHFASTLQEKWGAQATLQCRGSMSSQPRPLLQALPHSLFFSNTRRCRQMRQLRHRKAISPGLRVVVGVLVERHPRISENVKVVGPGGVGDVDLQVVLQDRTETTHKCYRNQGAMAVGAR